MIYHLAKYQHLIITATIIIISVSIDVIFIFILIALNPLPNTYYDFQLVW